MSEEIQLVAIFHPTPGKETRLKELLLSLGSVVYENEKGVTKYQMFEQVQVDSKTETNVILFQETYANKAAADNHLSTPYFIAMKETLIKEELLAKPFEVIILNPIGGFASRV